MFCSHKGIYKIWKTPFVGVGKCGRCLPFMGKCGIFAVEKTNKQKQLHSLKHKQGAPKRGE